MEMLECWSNQEPKAIAIQSETKSSKCAFEYHNNMMKELAEYAEDIFLVILAARDTGLASISVCCIFIGCNILI